MELTTRSKTIITDTGVENTLNVEFSYSNDDIDFTFEILDMDKEKMKECLKFTGSEYHSELEFGNGGEILQHGDYVNFCTRSNPNQLVSGFKVKRSKVEPLFKTLAVVCKAFIPEEEDSEKIVEGVLESNGTSSRRDQLEVINLGGLNVLESNGTSSRRDQLEGMTLRELNVLTKRLEMKNYFHSTKSQIIGDILAVEAWIDLKRIRASKILTESSSK